MNEACVWQEFDILVRDGVPIPFPVTDVCGRPSVETLVVRGSKIPLCVEHQGKAWLIRAALKEKQVPDA